MYSESIPFDYAIEYCGVLPKVPKWFEDEACTKLKKSFIGDYEYEVFENGFVTFKPNTPPEIKERFLKEYKEYLDELKRQHEMGNYSEDIQIHYDKG